MCHFPSVEKRSTQTMCRSRHFDSAAIEAEGGRSSLSLNLARGQREDIALLLAIVAALLSRYLIRGSFDFHQYRHAVILPIYTEPYSKRRFLPGQNLVRAICPGWLHLTHGRSHSEMPMLLTAELCGLYCSLYVVTYIYFLSGSTLLSWDKRRTTLSSLVQT